MTVLLRQLLAAILSCAVGISTFAVACPERSRRDGDGNRVSKTIAGATTKYLVDTENPTGYAQVIAELAGPLSNVQIAYVYGLEQISQNRRFASSNPISYFVHDGHGSVRDLTDPTGAVTDTYDYDAFGNLIHSSTTLSSPTPNNYLFAGEQFDPDLHLYYNRARYLNVSTGRFWSMDTDEGLDQDPLSLHKYLYTAGDPVNLTDPSGHDFDIGSIAIGASISGTLDAISAISAGQTLKGVAKSFVIGSVKGAAFFLAGGIAFKLLATAGEAAASFEAVQAAQQFISNVVGRAGPLLEGLQLPRFFSLSTGVGEVFVKQNATKHLEELLVRAGSAGATKLAAALAIDEVKTLVEQVAAEGLENIAGQRITTQLGSYTVQITIEKQAGQTVEYAITHLLFL